MTLGSLNSNTVMNFIKHKIYSMGRKGSYVCFGELNCSIRFLMFLMIVLPVRLVNAKQEIRSEFESS